MRELSFSQLWPKLTQPTCTTFRFTRKDRDWAVGETVKVLYKARSPKDRSVLGVAVIVKKQSKWVVIPNVIETLELGRRWTEKGYLINDYVAQRDGFTDLKAMCDFVGNRRFKEPMNMLTLAWEQIWLYIDSCQKPHVQKEWAALLKAGALARLTPRGHNAAYLIKKSVLEQIHDQAVLGNITVINTHKGSRDD